MCGGGGGAWFLCEGFFCAGSSLAVGFFVGTGFGFDGRLMERGDRASIDAAVRLEKHTSKGVCVSVGELDDYQCKRTCPFAPIDR